MDKNSIFDSGAFGRVASLFFVGMILSISTASAETGETLLAKINAHDMQGNPEYENHLRLKENMTVEDFQINCTCSNYMTTSGRVWRVMLRVKNMSKSTVNWQKIFPNNTNQWPPFFSLDFQNFTLTESATNSTYIEKLFPLDRYEEAINAVWNMVHIVNGKILALNTGKIIAYTIQDQGIDFRNTNQIIPTPVFRLDKLDMTKLWDSERKLNTVILNYFQIQ